MREHTVAISPRPIVEERYILITKWPAPGIINRLHKVFERTPAPVNKLRPFQCISLLSPALPTTTGCCGMQKPSAPSTPIDMAKSTSVKTSSIQPDPPDYLWELLHSSSVCPRNIKIKIRSRHTASIIVETKLDLQSGLNVMNLSGGDKRVSSDILERQRKEQE